MRGISGETMDTDMESEGEYDMLYMSRRTSCLTSRTSAAPHEDVGRPGRPDTPLLEAGVG